MRVGQPFELRRQRRGRVVVLILGRGGLAVKDHLVVFVQVQRQVGVGPDNDVYVLVRVAPDALAGAVAPPVDSQAPLVGNGAAHHEDVERRVVDLASDAPVFAGPGEDANLVVDPVIGQDAGVPACRTAWWDPA